MKKALCLAILASLILVCSQAAMAQPRHLQPGSVLIFPAYDSSAGAGTVICLTNLNTNTEYCQATDMRKGDIMVHYQYIDGVTWREFDRFETLTPGDTLCVLADNHNPEQDTGFLVVSAADPVDMDRKVDFDHIIGSAIVVQSGLNFLWQYTPYVFRGLPQLGVPGDYCSLPSTDGTAGGTDGGTADGALDFDNSEYDYFPAQLFIDSFFEETGSFTNQLTMLSMAGATYESEANFLFWNNIEQKFSRGYRFTCWNQGALSEISAIVTNLGGDDNELGQGTIETGWASITGGRILDGSGNPVLKDGDTENAQAPLLGVFAQFITASDFASGHALHYTGTLDGLEFIVGNGDQQL